MTVQSELPKKQQGYRRNREEATELFLSNMKLVPSIIVKMGLPVTEDIVQDGYIGLWKASLRYDESRNRKFSAYAAPAIRNSIIQTWRPTEKSVTSDCYLSQTKSNDDDSGTLENIIADPASEVRFRNAEFRIYFDSALTDTERNVVSMLLDGLSKRKIGKRMGRSDCWVEYRIAEIRKKLKKDF